MAPETSSSIALAQQPGALAGIARWATSSARLLGSIAVIALFASPFTLANAAESSQRMAQEQHACTVVMGLHRPGDLYDTCIRSLDKSLSELNQAKLASTEERTCALEGLKTGTSGYAVCVVNAEQSATHANGSGANTP